MRRVRSGSPGRSRSRTGLPIRALAMLVVAVACILPVSGCALGPRGVAAQPPRDAYAYVAQAVSATLPIYTAPGGRVLTQLRNPNAFNDRLVLLATGRDGDWLKVLLPIRPNGSSGWVPSSSVQLAWVPWRVTVDRSARRLTLSNAGHVVMTTPVAVGSTSTPTPLGTFYLTSLLRPPDPGGAYGPFAFGLSGYSPVLKRFAGGPGEIGLHGTDDPASIGRSVTHGCIRVSNRVITTLAGRLPLGTPVVVTA